MSAVGQCLELLKKNDFDGLRQLIEAEPGCAEGRDTNGVSLLMQSIYRGQRDLAELIAAQKTELDIFEAASLGRLERLGELARDPVAVRSRSADGFTALHYACFFSSPEAVRLLIEAGAAVDAVAPNPMKVMPLHSAASVGNLEAARMLLERGAPVNARQQGGWAPLRASAQNGDRGMVGLLLSHGADPGAANDEGKTAAMVAREKGHGEIADLLESR